MRMHFSSVGFLLALGVPVMAGAQPMAPDVAQIAQALGRPAPVAAPASSHAVGGDPLRVTAAMLRGPTRGIIPAMPAQPPTSMSAASGMRLSGQNPCPAGSGVCALAVEFETGSAILTSNAIAALDNLGKALASLHDQSFRFRVEGHTDTVGSEELNLSLSEHRAVAVRSYLSEHFSIDPTRLEPVGLGKEKPLVPTPDQTPEPRNRRVQVVNIGA